MTKRHARAAARETANTFLQALLAAEVGDRSPRVLRAFRRSADPALATELTALPARRPPGRSWPRPARLTGLTVLGSSAGQTKAIAILARPGRGRSVLELILQRRGGHWRVRRFG